MAWTPDRIEILTTLWTEGHSAKKIANKFCDVTVIEVIGKAKQLELTRGVPSEKPAVEIKVPLLIPKDFELPPILSSDIKSWMCRWQTDDAGRHGFNICGNTVQPGRHYCAEHITESFLEQRRDADKPKQTDFTYNADGDLV